MCYYCVRVRVATVAWNGMNLEVSKKLGRINIGEEFLQTLALDSQLRTAFGSNFVVLRAEFDYASSIFEYTCYSPLFNVINAGECMPEYTVHILQHVDANDDITFDVAVEIKS